MLSKKNAFVVFETNRIILRIPKKDFLENPNFSLDIFDDLKHLVEVFDAHTRHPFTPCQYQLTLEPIPVYLPGRGRTNNATF